MRCRWIQEALLPQSMVPRSPPAANSLRLPPLLHQTPFCKKPHTEQPLLQLNSTTFQLSSMRQKYAKAAPSGAVHCSQMHSMCKLSSRDDSHDIDTNLPMRRCCSGKSPCTTRASFFFTKTHSRLLVSQYRMEDYLPVMKVTLKPRLWSSL